MNCKYFLPCGICEKTGNLCSNSNRSTQWFNPYTGAPWYESVTDDQFNYIKFDYSPYIIKTTAGTNEYRR